MGVWTESMCERWNSEVGTPPSMRARGTRCERWGREAGGEKNETRTHTDSRVRNGKTAGWDLNRRFWILWSVLDDIWMSVCTWALPVGSGVKKRRGRSVTRLSTTCSRRDT